MTSRETPREAGFSLVELMVAMIVTTIIAMAVFTLMGAGQSAFQREPQLSDRQQNIRIAMDAIKRDVSLAGAGMAPFVQAFRTGLNGFSPIASPIAAEGNTDWLEILSSSSCRTITLVPAAPAGGPFDSFERLPDCYPDSSVAEGGRFFYVGNIAAGADMRSYGVVLGKADAAHPAPGGTPPVLKINVIGTANRNPPGGFCAGGNCRSLDLINVVQYRIADDPNFPGLTGLWRSETGGLDNAGNDAPPPAPNWQLVAVGIEDLQVTYRHTPDLAPGVVNPGLVSCAATPCTAPTATDFDTIVREVTITLGARVVSNARMQGQSTSALGTTVIRGRLTTTVAPRAALLALTQNTATHQWY